MQSMKDKGPDKAGNRKAGAVPRAVTDELAQRRKDAAHADDIRQAVTESATELLRSLAPDQAIPAVLERIGRAGRVSRVQLYTNEQEDTGRIAPTLWLEWDAPGVGSAAALNDRLDHDVWDRERLIPALAKGEPLAVLTRQADEPFRSVLSATGIKSVLIVPIFVEDRWWGQLGLDDCEQERVWTAVEIDSAEDAGRNGGREYRARARPGGGGGG